MVAPISSLTLSLHCFQDEDKENDAERAKKCHNAINGITEPAAGGDAAAASGAATEQAPAQAPR